MFDYAIFSNTKFSKDALKYANGVGLKIFSMDYPDKNTFIDLVMRYKVYPITVLRKLKVVYQRKLLALGIVTIKQVKASDLARLGLDEREVKVSLAEINKIFFNTFIRNNMNYRNGMFCSNSFCMPLHKISFCSGNIIGVPT